MTPLDKTLKRSLRLDGIDYVITVSPEALKLTRKGRRIGVELKWADIISGEGAMAVALQASIGSLAAGGHAGRESTAARPADKASTRQSRRTTARS
jgi:hypothetical protein